VKFVEALFSLIILTVIALSVLSVPVRVGTPSVYKEQLAQDVWRIVQLKYGNLPSATSLDHARLEMDLDKIRDMTGLCVYITGVRITNCRGIEAEDVVTIHRYYVDYTPVPVLKPVSITLKREKK